MDETLVSSDFVWAKTPEKLLSSRFIDNDVDYAAMFYSEGLSSVVASLQSRFFQNHEKGDIFAFLSSIAEDGYRKIVTLKPGATAVIETVEKLGFLTVILTANRKSLYSIIRNRFPIFVDKWFSTMDLGLGKGDCHIYDIIAGYFGLRPDECVLFDDSEYALLGAKKAGLLSICVSNGKMKSSSVADYTIETLEDFREDMLCG